MHVHNSHWIVLALLGTSFMIQFAGACLKSAKPQPSAPVTTTAPFVQILNCTLNETLKQNCLNNGECQVNFNTIEETRTRFCQCDNRYAGDRCQRRKPPVQVTTQEMGQASLIAACVVGGVIVLIIVIVIVVVCRLRSRQDIQNLNLIRQRQRQNNGSAINNETAHNTNQESEDLLELHRMSNGVNSHPA